MRRRLLLILKPWVSTNLGKARWPQKSQQVWQGLLALGVECLNFTVSVTGGHPQEPEDGIGKGSYRLGEMPLHTLSQPLRDAGPTMWWVAGRLFSLSGESSRLSKAPTIVCTTCRGAGTGPVQVRMDCTPDHLFFLFSFLSSSPASSRGVQVCKVCKRLAGNACHATL